MTKLFTSFVHAIAGFRYAVRTQRTLRIHLVIAAVVGALVVWLALPFAEAAVVVLAMIAVIGAELLNTAVEALIDLLVAQHQHPLAKTAKDLAAAMVLVTAFGAAVVGILLLGPPLGTRVGLSPELAVRGARLTVLVAAAAAVAILIRLSRPPRDPSRVSLPEGSRDR